MLQEAADTGDNQLTGDQEDVGQLSLELKDRSEEEAFSYLCGWVTHKTCQKVCPTCNILISTDGTDSENVSFIHQKEFKPGCLNIPSKDVLDFLKKCNAVLTKLICTHEKDKNIKQMVDRALTTLVAGATTIPNCCELAEKLAQQFGKFKLHLHAKQHTSKIVQNSLKGVARSSKSVYKKFCVQ